MTDEEKQAIEYFENKLQELKEEIKERQNDEFKGYGTLEDIAKLKYCNLHTMLNLIEKQQAELEKKDKIIDEMATYIATLDIEEDICEKTKNEHCDKMNFGECEDCIKQYYERKVEDK